MVQKHRACSYNIKFRVREILPKRSPLRGKNMGKEFRDRNRLFWETRLWLSIACSNNKRGRAAQIGARSAKCDFATREGFRMKGRPFFVMTRAHSLKCHFDRSVSGVEKSLLHYKQGRDVSTRAPASIGRGRSATSRFALVRRYASGNMTKRSYFALCVRAVASNGALGST